MIDVSVVIVCMNNLRNLYPCLDSIKGYTSVNYEVLVVAYLFTQENLKSARADYPWVTFVESNEIRGFSENNNLALKRAKGTFCFVLNDDTYFTTPVVDELVGKLKQMPENVAVLSPTVYGVNGVVQHCGRPQYNLFTILLYYCGLLRYYENHSKYTNKKGMFKSYNIFGAAFLIRTSVFEKMGWFDEQYFFCPEDIALSTKLNNKGYSCYVDSDIKLTHIGGGTWSKTIQATKPATEKGNLAFFGGDRLVYRFIYKVLSVSTHFLRFLYWNVVQQKDSVKKEIMKKANLNAVKAVLSKETPKQIFVKYYNEIKL